MNQQSVVGETIQIILIACAILLLILSQSGLLNPKENLLSQGDPVSNVDSRPIRTYSRATDGSLRFRPAYEPSRSFSSTQVPVNVE